METFIPFIFFIAIISIIVALFYKSLLYQATFKFSFKRLPKRKPKVFLNEEIIEGLVIILFEYVQNNQVSLFSTMIGYYGYDKARHLKTHLNLEESLESQKIALYINAFREIFEEYQKISPETDFYGHLTPEFLISNKAVKIKVDSMEFFRVYIQLCSGDDEKNCSETYAFDFIKGRKEFLLVDVQEQQLYKKLTSYEGAYRF